MLQFILKMKCEKLTSIYDNENRHPMQSDNLTNIDPN